MHNEHPRKDQVRRAFERAASTYDQAATVQHTVCEQLLRDLPTGIQPQRILDAGCGTGYAHTLLGHHFPQAEITGLDLAAAMLHQHPAHPLKVQADLEQLPIAASSMDLYWSSLAVQWCDLGRVLSEARRILSAGGWLALATLGEETFCELRQTFAGLDHYAHTLSFDSMDTLQAALQQNGLKVFRWERHPEQAFYPDLTTLLKAVKAVGANQVGSGRRTGLFSRHLLDQLTQRYETLRTPAGLPLTYDVIRLYAR